MSKRILMFGAVLAIFVLAMVGILFTLDAITIREATNTLGRTLSVILISITAIVLSLTVVRIAKKG
jgi:hypothetical protein